MTVCRADPKRCETAERTTGMFVRATDVQAAINAARADLPTSLRQNPSYYKVNPAAGTGRDPGDDL
jgi:hypothetical protein